MMKWFVVLLVSALMIGTSLSAVAEDVYVKGYYRSDGTYVRPHYRSSPDSYKWNNYGPSQNTFELTNPRSRDQDKDGIPNYLDFDDDNDGILDDWE